MNKFETIQHYLFVVGVIILCIWFLGKCGNKTQPIETIKTDTVTVTQIDTIKLTNEIIKYKPSPIRRDTVFIKDEALITNTYSMDSVIVDSQGVNTSYNLYIQVKQNELDSVKLTLNTKVPKVTETKTVTNEVVKYKKKHWNYGLQAGVGYGLINRKPDVYLGFGVQYSF